jgi:hypothetical protein
MKLSNKYELGELVFHNGVAYWVTAVIAKPGYDSIDWDYYLTKPAYRSADEVSVKSMGASLDLKSVHVHEYQIETEKEAKERRLKELLDKQDALNREILKLQAEKQAILGES